MSITLSRPAGTFPRGSVRLTYAALADGTALVTVTGELDAHNAREVVAFVDAMPGSFPGLILNLGNLAFFGTEGLWAVNRINAACAKRRAASVIVVGAAASRVLRICDPHNALRVVTTMDDALPAVRQRARPLTVPQL